MQRTWTGKVFIATSLDGYIARADGDIAWLTDPPRDASHVAPPTPPPSGFDYDSHMSTVDHLVMGRATYEKVLTFGDWPFPDHRVLVLSTTSRTDDDRITIVRSTEDAVDDLNRHGAKGVYVDGGQVIADFLRRGLIDELTLTRAPVLLGSGLPLFGSLDGDIRLTHLGTTTVGSGMTTSRYRIG